MESKKVKCALTIVYAALFTAILIAFSNFSAIIQSHCKCITYATIYHDDLVGENFNFNSNTSDLFHQMNMDVRLQHPYTCLVAGPTSCGKTQFVKKIIEEGEHMTNGSAEKIIWLYGEYQPAYTELSQKFPNVHVLKESQKT